MTEPELWKLIVRYLSGEGTAADAEAVRSWAASDPEHQALLSSLESTWDDAARLSDQGEPADSWDVDAGWAQLDARRRRASAPPVLRLETTRPRQRWPRRVTAIARVAAAVVLFFGAGALGSRLHDRLVRPGNEPQAFSTERGQRARLRLGDGTEVLLGPATSVVIPGEFREGDRRELYLTGVAYFEVAPNPEVPFIVRAGATRTQVVGTQFGVRAHPGDGEVEVVVAEGEVRFSSDGSSSTDSAVALTPGLRARYSRGESSIVTDTVDVDGVLGWRVGELTFDDEPLADVVVELERWFAIDFRVADREAVARRFSGTFRTESVREIVDILTVALELRHTRDGDTIVFRALASPGEGPIDSAHR